MCYLERTTRLSDDTPPVCRLGLASRGNTHLPVGSVRRAIDKGVNYLNWCGHADGLSQAVGQLSVAEGENVVVAVQLSARRAEQADRELTAILQELQSDYVDVLTFYYVEAMAEWECINGSGGAMDVMRQACGDGKVRRLGLTTHQRKLGAQVARSRCLDLLMVRYNAAHRGAEQDVFPTTRSMHMPIVAFTCLRWGALLRSTPDDPLGFTPPDAADWYRFVLAQSDIAVALMAPNDHAELVENLKLLDDWRAPNPERLAMLKAHGDRVRQHGGGFP